MVNTKRFLSSKTWLSNMENLVEKEVKHCLPCQSNVYQHDRGTFCHVRVTGWTTGASHRGLPFGSNR